MQVLQGIAVSPGVAIGEALVMDNEGFRIPRRFVTRDAVEDELQRLDQAVEAVASEIERNRETISRQLGEKTGAIFSAHLQMLRDRHLHDELQRLIGQCHYSPEYAVSRTLRGYAKVFQQLGGSGYLANDIFDIEQSLLRNLLGRCREELAHLASPVVVLAHTLTPSETAALDPQLVLGIVTETGGASDHTAIVAKGLEIPAVVGIGKFLADVSGGDRVVVDGDQGRVILQPDEASLARYRREAEAHRSLAAQLQESLRDLPAETCDGRRIMITANIEFPHEVETCLHRGADGIGLYRTEFLYLGRQGEPSEEDHYRAYAEVVQAMGDRPVVIRTLDLGADKMGQLPPDEEEKNPFLGLRSIRLSLRNLAVFRVQLRAILKASTLGNVYLMFPMITTLAEWRQAKTVLADAMEDLDEEGIPFDRQLPTGMMVEVPAAVTMLDVFLKEVDFISIGTNDLIQYTLAVDRGNKEVAELYHDSDPAVLRLIQSAIEAAERAAIPVSLCGEMSAKATYTMLLLGMGLRGLSVPPSAIAEIKKICRSVTVPQCRQVAQRALEMDNALEIDNYLREELRRVCPELLHGPAAP